MDPVSETLGWGYFVAWSLSFYPQVWLTFRRQGTKGGLSIDFQWLNLMGFTCYSIGNALFYWDSRVKQDEIARGASTGLVKENDVLFAWHALVLTAVTLGQVYYYDVPPPIMTPMVRRAMWVVIVVLGMCAVRTWMVDARWDEDDGFVEHNAWTYLGFAIIVSFVKLGVSLVKYVPQAWLNYTRKSTEGFAIWNILLDFTGGMLSLMQLVYDASSEGDWTRVTDNPHNVWFRKPSSSKGYGTTDGSEYSRVTIDDDDESRGGDS